MLVSLEDHLLHVELPKVAGTLVPLMLRWVEPGTFEMGADPTSENDFYEEYPAFQATISNGFWLSIFPVTQTQWRSLGFENPSFFKDQANCPVENLTWNEAVNWCKYLTKLAGSDLPAGYTFHLPTEAQWEYVCKAGTAGTPYDIQTWYVHESAEQTRPTGSQGPNPWGFYDLYGNVFQWCYDAAEDYPPIQPIDRVGRANPQVRAFRGSSYKTSWGEFGGIHCAYRGGVPPETRRPWLGFRVCLSLQQF